MDKLFEFMVTVAPWIIALYGISTCVCLIIAVAIFANAVRMFRHTERRAREAEKRMRQ